MNIAVKFYSQSQSAPAGIPADFPWQCLEEQDPSYQEWVNSGAAVMTIEEYAAYKAARQAQYDAWESAQVQP